MRFSIWIPRTPSGLLASILAGITIAAVLYLGPFGAPSFDAPYGTQEKFREEQAFVIIAIATLAGGSWIGTRLERRRLLPQTRWPRWFSESADRLIADEARQAQDIDAIRRSPWFADSIIDLNAARHRAARDHEVVFQVSFLRIPNPYFVLRAEAIVKWGFATASQVASAYVMAGDGTAPAIWHDPALMRDLGYMGWDRTESVARIGLFMESLERPNRTKPD